MNYDAADLNLFAAVVEEGSFAKAATRLDLPNSTLSRRIAMLEQQLGERLLIRTTRKMSVTDFGQAVFRHAQQISAELSAVDALTEQRKITPSGLLRVSLPGDFTQDIIGQCLAEFIETYPLVTLEIDASQRRVDLISEGFDIALRIGALPDDSSLVARLVGQFEIGLFAAPSYLRQHTAITHPQDLLNCAMLKLNSDLLPMQLFRGKEHWQSELAAKALANSPSILINLALRGAGITRLSVNAVQPYVERRQLVRILPEWQSKKRPVWVVFPGGRLMPSKTRLFIDSLVRSFEQLT